MKERIEMIVKMQVTQAQGLALKAMFEHWNLLSSWGSSREIAFYVDGDGNFHPKAEVAFSDSLPDLTDTLRKKAMVREKEGDILFDYDSIAWEIEP